jgi:hypothetical protein
VDVVTIEAGECGTDELLERLRGGTRVTVRTELLGNPHEVTLRWDGEQFYCDTPTTLHRHETEAGMRECIAKHGYCRT